TGIVYALLAALVWPVHAMGWIPYPATLHWTLMIQGFIHSFVLGFLMTALPAFLHAGKARPAETALVFGATVAFGVFALCGMFAAAQAAYIASILILIVTAARRLPRRHGDPPEEFVFVALGLLFGIAGGVLGLGVAAGWWEEPAPRFALHLISKGMLISIVLGVGGLLVPTFSAMSKPLVIPGIARPGQRGPRRALYIPLGLALIAAAALDAAGRAGVAAWLRALVGTALGMLVWKLFRRPGRRDLLSSTIWIAGWMIIVGLWLSALVPTRAILGFHVVFLGGFGLLILGIATRVVVTHGGYPQLRERLVLRPVVVAAVALALLARVASDFFPPYAVRIYGVSGAFWITAWIAWSWGALPYIVRRAGEPVLPPDHPQRILLQNHRSAVSPPPTIE
ncbi:MAG TPA: NnrS family protein, partial [Candidatus Eisenbacteria bacterium]